MISYNLLIMGHVYFMYMLKAVQYGFLFASIYLSERLFTDHYMKKVYTESQQPPNLFWFLGVCLAFHLAMNLMLATFLFMVMMLFKRDNNTFIVNGYTIKTYLMDYVASFTYLAVLSSIIIGVMQQKKYFRYRTEGLRAVRGVSEIMTYIGIVIFMIPFFYLLA